MSMYEIRVHLYGPDAHYRSGSFKTEAEDLFAAAGKFNTWMSGVMAATPVRILVEGINEGHQTCAISIYDFPDCQEIFKKVMNTQ